MPKAALPTFEVIMLALEGLHPTQHPQRLKELMAMCAAALRFASGPEVATEEAYRVGDMMAGEP